MQVSKPIWNQKPYIFLLIAQLAIGAAAIFARYALTGTGPITVSALRLTIAAIPFLFTALWRLQKQKNLIHSKINWSAEAGLVLAGIALGLHFATWISSLSEISVAVSTLLVCTTPIWTALYEVFVIKKRPSRFFWLALALSLVGVALVSGLLNSSGANSPKGMGLALMGSVLIGFYLVVIEKVGRQGASSSGFSTQAMITRTYSWAALSLLWMSWNSSESFPSFHNQAAWGGILGMAVISQALGHTLLNISVRNFTPSFVAFCTLLEPIFAAALAAWIFSERLSQSALIGGMMVLAGLIILVRDQKNSNE